MKILFLDLKCLVEAAYAISSFLWYRVFLFLEAEVCIIFFIFDWLIVTCNGDFWQVI